MFPGNFEIANRFTQKWEAGFVNHPKDPGGVTYNGLSLRFLKQTGTDINGDGVINAEDILTLYRNGDQDSVDEIFYKAFWRDPSLEQFKFLPLQTAIYDTNVNVGRTQSVKFLQRACNDILPISKYASYNMPKLADDGVIGPKTQLRALSLAEEDNGLKLALAFLDRRMGFHNMLVNNSSYPDKRDYRPFAAGWRNRVNDLVKYIKGL